MKLCRKGLQFQLFRLIVVLRLEQVRNWCGPKRAAFTWFSLRENPRLLSDHRNCETALSAAERLMDAFFGTRPRGVPFQSRPVLVWA
jgi:hypothetical protein